MFVPTNQRKSKLKFNSSINNRSLRNVYSTSSSSARNNLSGAIEGRPISAYIFSNWGDSLPH